MEGITVKSHQSKCGCTIFDRLVKYNLGKCDRSSHLRFKHLQMEVRWNRTAYGSFDSLGYLGLLEKHYQPQAL